VTHRGPFQARPFCDSVILAISYEFCHQLGLSTFTTLLLVLSFAPLIDMRKHVEKSTHFIKYPPNWCSNLIDIAGRLLRPGLVCVVLLQFRAERRSGSLGLAVWWSLVCRAVIGFQGAHLQLLFSFGFWITKEFEGFVVSLQRHYGIISYYAD